MTLLGGLKENPGHNYCYILLQYLSIIIQKRLMNYIGRFSFSMSESFKVFSSNLISSSSFFLFSCKLTCSSFKALYCSFSTSACVTVAGLFFFMDCTAVFGLVACISMLFSCWEGTDGGEEFETCSKPQSSASTADTVEASKLVLCSSYWTGDVDTDWDWNSGTGIDADVGAPN